MLDFFKNLIYQLPPIFSRLDTYKDVDGKGILERFLGICGEYLNEIHSEIDNITDVIDIDLNSDIYLGILWEFFGSIPYAYKSKSDLESDISLMPLPDTRNLLKYIISLYKIRGTNYFYDILLRFYGFGSIEYPACLITDESDVPPGPVVDVFTHYDDGIYDDYYYDKVSDCNLCSKVTVVVNIVDPNWATYAQQDIDNLYKRVYLILNKFRPINVEEFDESNVTFDIHIEDNNFYTYRINLIQLLDNNILNHK